MNKVNLIRRIGAMCLVFVLVLGMIPSTAYQAAEDRGLVVNVDTTKATVVVHETGNEDRVVTPSVGVGIVEYALDSAINYTLKISANNSAIGDGIEAVADGAGTIADGIYTEEIPAAADALVRTATLKSEVLYDYTITMDMTKGTITLEPVRSIGAAIAGPVIPDTNDSCTYRLSPYEVYSLTVNADANAGEKLDFVLDQPVEGVTTYTILNVVPTGANESKPVSFYSETPFDINITMDSENGTVVAKNTDILDETLNIVGSVTANGVVQVIKGGNYSIEVSANDGYGIKSVTVGGVEQEVSSPIEIQRYSVTNVMQNVDVIVEYAPVYDVVINVNKASVPENKIVFNGTEVTDATYTVKVLENESVQLDMTPVTDYYVSGLAITNNSVTAEEVALSGVTIASGVYSYGINAVTENVTVDVTFSAIPEVEEATLQDTSVFTFDSSLVGALASGNVEDKNTYVEYILTKNESVEVSTTGKTISTTQSGTFEDALTVNDTNKIESIYAFDENSATLSGSIVKHNFVKPIQFILDDTAPVVEIENASGVLWLAGDVTNPAEFTSKNIIINATEGDTSDDTSVSRVVYVNNENATYEDILNGTEIVESNGKYVLNVSTAEFITWGVDELTYYVYAINESEYCSEVKAQKVKLDSVKPCITTIVAEDTTGFIDKIFTKDKDVTLYIAPEDAEGSGVSEVTLYISTDGQNFNPVGTVNEFNKVEAFADNKLYASFELKDLGHYVNYTIYAVANDNVGNSSTEYSAVEGTSGSDITSNILYFDSVKPTISIAIEETETLAKGENQTYYIKSGVFTPSFIIKDYTNESDKDYVGGIASYSIKINDKPVLEENYSSRVVEDVITLEESHYSSARVTLNEDSCYVIVVDVTDAAGNVETSTYKCYVDATAPVLISKEVINGKTIEGYDTYEFFSNGVTKYKFTVENNDGDSGLGYISCKLEDEDIIRAGQIIGNTAVIVIEREKDYKGKVDVTLTDRVGNITTTELNVIIETTDASNVSLTPAETPYKSGNANLYATDTKVAVVVEDEFSGISSVAWSVEGDIDKSKDSNGTINVLREKQNKGDDEANATWSWSLSDSSWTLEEDAENLVTKVSGEIPVTHNSNNIKIHLVLIDNAGNEKTAEQVISIDKTAPKVEIAFSNTEGDTVYNVDRTATITVYDNNFVAGNTSVKITNTDGSVPSVSAWKSNNNVNNLAYSATVTFTADGDYNMEVSTKDAANRASNVAKIEQFTIDKTAPTISVSYDNTPSINETYFAATRTATVTINEHNFNASNVVVEGVATFNGAPAAFPGVTGWASGGDTRSTNLVFNQDALYSYSISVTDAAGNTAQLSENAFTVDTTAPVIEISGVEDMSANNGVVAPVITITDENYDAGGVNIELVGSNHGQVQANGSFSDVANGQVFTFANFAEEQDLDDLYTLNVTKTDKAGNMFEDSISFSVNRFGSVYTFSEELAEINGNYVQEPIDVVITETNVDSLDMDSVKVVLTTNGNPSTLERGEDYTISQTGGGGSWSQYEYRIGKEMFQEDGSYSIAIYSVDNAGNVNENINETKEAEVFFGIDTVDPIITAIDLESGKTYEATEHRAVLSITDNLVLGEVVITVNGEPVEYEVNGTDYSFVLSEASKAYSISVSVVDKAGNMAVMTFDDVWVTTSALVRVLNSPVAIAVGAGTVGVAGVGGGAFVFMRRKNVIKVKRK